MPGFARYSGTETHIRIDDDVTSIPECAFENRDVVDVVLPEGLKHIGHCAFDGCTSLQKINLPDGLLTIENGAFRACNVLPTIHIPSSVTVIGAAAFFECTALKEVALHEGSLRVIGTQAFYDCPSLVKISIPSTVGFIGDAAFWGCKSLTEVNLCEGLRRIDEGAFRDCISLLRINIPSTMAFIDETAFDNCRILRNVAISPSTQLREFWTTYRANTMFQDLDCTFDMLRNRFDKLPLHEFCFYHSRQAIMEYIDPFEWIKNNYDGEPPSPSPVDCSKVDFLGMTPLHVLACSGTHDILLYQRIIDSYPGALIATDEWSDVPLTYIMLSDAPMEILHFFLEMHKREWGKMPFDFATLITRMVNCKSGERIRQVIQAQRKVFPEVEVNWQVIVDESKSIDCMVPLSMFRILVEAFASSRSVCMNFEHQLEVDERIAGIQRIYFDPFTHLEGSQRTAFLDRLMAISDEGTPLDYDRLIGFDDDYRIGLLNEIQGMIMNFTQIRDELLLGASTTLELALWKAVVNEFPQYQPKNGIEDIGKKRVDCRLIGGKMYQVVIPNVLSFL